MTIKRDTEIPCHTLPGLRHQTLASGRDLGLEIWKQTLLPGAGTPVHRHDCVEVIVCLRGSGALLSAGQEQRFAAPATLVLQPNEVHQLVNTGPDEMELVATLGMAPVVVQTADGQTIPLPWSEAYSAAHSH